MYMYMYSYTSNGRSIHTHVCRRKGRRNEIQGIEMWEGRTRERVKRGEGVFTQHMYLHRNISMLTFMLGSI